MLPFFEQGDEVVILNHETKSIEEGIWVIESLLEVAGEFFYTLSGYNGAIFPENVLALVEEFTSYDDYIQEYGTGIEFNQISDILVERNFDIGDLVMKQGLIYKVISYTVKTKYLTPFDYTTSVEYEIEDIITKQKTTTDDKSAFVLARKEFAGSFIETFEKESKELFQSKTDEVLDFYNNMKTLFALTNDTHYESVANILIEKLEKGEPINLERYLTHIKDDENDEEEEN